MPAKKTAAPAISVADLRLALRDTVARLGKPVTAGELRKALPKPYQRPVAEIGGALADLAGDGALLAVKDGKSLRYTDRDPASVLAPAIQAALKGGPLDGKKLAAEVKRAAPGFEKMLAGVLAAEVARGAVREHPKAGKTPARYGLTPPDPTPHLAKAIAEVKAVAKKLAAHGVTEAMIHAAIGRALRLEAPADPRADEAQILAALAELSSREPPGSLLSVRGLRALSALDKARFDGAVMRLARADKITIHQHDFPASLADADREALVRDEHGVHYVGVAPREAAP